MTDAAVPELPASAGGAELLGVAGAVAGASCSNCSALPDLRC